jgi:DNA-binding response OmpR family regulator
MAKGRQIGSLVAEKSHRGGFRDRPRYAYSPKKVVLFQINDRQIEQEWALMLESWGIGSISVSTEDALIANLHRAKLILFGLDRCSLDILSIASLKSSRPVIPLVAVGCEVDGSNRIEILDLGVEDYIEKSSSAREVVARVRAILRRREHSIYRFGEEFHRWSMDACTREVRLPSGERVFLSRAEFDLMKVFIEFPDRIFTAQELSMTVFSDNRQRSRAGVVRLIGNIRMKFDASSIRARVIQTVHHKGYRLICKTEDLDRFRIRGPKDVSLDGEPPQNL